MILWYSKALVFKVWCGELWETGVLKALSGALWGQHDFHNNTKALFAFKILILLQIYCVFLEATWDLNILNIEAGMRIQLSAL